VFPEEYRSRATIPGGWAGAICSRPFLKFFVKWGFSLGLVFTIHLIHPVNQIWHKVFLLSAVTKWFGNEPIVALRHYVDPTDESFSKALSWVPKRGVSISISASFSYNW